MSKEQLTTVYSNPSDSGIIAAAALQKNGINILDKNDNGVCKNGPAVAKTIHDLAKEAGASLTESFEERAKAFDEVEGLTDAALNKLDLFSKAIVTREAEHKDILEYIRTFRMTLTSELSIIETSIKKIQSLGTPKLVADLEAIGKALSNPYIQKLLKGDADGNQG